MNFQSALDQLDKVKAELESLEKQEQEFKKKEEELKKKERVCYNVYLVKFTVQDNHRPTDRPQRLKKEKQLRIFSSSCERPEK